MRFRLLAQHSGFYRMYAEERCAGCVLAILLSMYSTAENRRKLRRLLILDLPVQHKVTNIAERAHGARRREYGQVRQRALGGLLGLIYSQISAASRKHCRNKLRHFSRVGPGRTGELAQQRAAAPCDGV